MLERNIQETGVDMTVVQESLNKMTKCITVGFSRRNISHHRKILE